MKMDAKKVKYSLLVLAVGILIGFGVVVWVVPENKFIPENDKAGLGTGYLGEEFKYNVEEYKKVEPKLVLYKEIEGFETGFKEASGLFIDGQDKIYVCGDTGVRVFDSKQVFLGEVKSKERITAITVTKEGLIYAAAQDKVLFRNKSFGSKGKKKGEFEYITSMLAAGDRLYIADAGNRRVAIFDLNGKFIKEFGQKDTAKGIKGFVIPGPHMDLALAGDGNLWVADTGRRSLEKYSPEGFLLGSWGKSGVKIEDFIGCCNPCNFTLTKEGTFITSEKGLPRIKIYDKTGKFTGVVAPPSVFSEKCVNMAVAVDSKHRVYALDSVKRSVRRFEKKK